ncbi:hypothetical protein NG796_16715 [Laspinema sp. A4]|uniref:hypothetical protein n=1 Tax=Laspinema sp. D2d TaxID=2953686 RepID=UPI0021BB2E1F|nr:hypothetical protein [Laspinema sp. D2d]MCT7984915.1 hypothetical protein [Laspinema sp. D2d]
MNNTVFADLFGSARLVLCPELAATLAQIDDAQYKTWAVDMALVLQQLDFWMKGHSGETDSQGRRWIHNSLQTWQEQFPWMSIWGVRQALEKLRELGLVLFEKRKKQHWWHRGWYSLDYEALQRLKPLPDSMCESPHIHESASPHIDVRDSHTSKQKTSLQKSHPTKEGWPANAQEEEAPQTSRVTPAVKTKTLASQHTPTETNVPQVASNETNSPASGQTVTVSVVARPASNNLTQEVKDRLAACQIPLDKKVVGDIEKHHLSQVRGALAHVEATWESIDNPRGVFLFQLSKQPVEQLGTRLPVYSVETAPGTQVEPSEPPTGFFDSLRKKFGRK